MNIFEAIMQWHIQLEKLIGSIQIVFLFTIYLSNANFHFGNEIYMLENPLIAFYTKKNQNFQPLW